MQSNEARNMPRGIVSEHLVSLLVKQVEERSLVVWYDPGADYRAVADGLEIPGATSPYWKAEYNLAYAGKWKERRERPA